jgi:hypothetical protein
MRMSFAPCINGRIDASITPLQVVRESPGIKVALQQRLSQPDNARRALFAAMLPEVRGCWNAHPGDLSLQTAADLIGTKIESGIAVLPAG